MQRRHRTSWNDVPRPALVKIVGMWRRLHVLSPVQALIVTSVSSASIALALAARSSAGNEIAMLRLWPYTLDPYLTFSFIFVGLVSVLLGYYHLGRLGFLLNIGAGFAFAWIMAACGILSFWGVGHFVGSVQLSTVAYAACV